MPPDARSTPDVTLGVSADKIDEMAGLARVYGDGYWGLQPLSLVLSGRNSFFDCLQRFL